MFNGRHRKSDFDDRTDRISAGSIYYFYSILGEPERRLCNAMLEVAEHSDEEGFEKNLPLRKDQKTKGIINLALFFFRPREGAMIRIRHGSFHAKSI